MVIAESLVLGLCGSSCKEFFNVRSRGVATAATLRYRLLDERTVARGFVLRDLRASKD
jgi:hypothetical protein